MLDACGFSVSQVDVRTCCCSTRPASHPAGYVARAMGICLAVLAGFLWWVRQNSASLGGVWWGLVAFFALRAGQSLPRLLATTLSARRADPAPSAA